MKKCSGWVVMLVLFVLLFVMALPAVAFAVDVGDTSSGTVAVTWARLLPLGFVVLAVVDALKKEFKDVTGHDLKRLWVITAAFVAGSCAAILSAYWLVLPPWIQLILGGGALGLTVSGVVKLGDYGADFIAKSRSAVEVPAPWMDPDR